MESQLTNEPLIGESAGDKEATISMADLPSIVKLSVCHGMIKMLQLIALIIMIIGLTLFGLTLQGTVLGLGLFVLSVAMLLIAEAFQDPDRTPMSIYRPPTFRISPFKRCLRSGFWIGTITAFILSLALIAVVVVNLKHASTYDAAPQKMYVGNNSSPQNTSCYLPTVRNFHFTTNVIELVISFCLVYVQGFCTTFLKHNPCEVRCNAFHIVHWISWVMLLFFVPLNARTVVAWTRAPSDASVMMPVPDVKEIPSMVSLTLEVLSYGGVLVAFFNSLVVLPLQNFGCNCRNFPRKRKTALDRWLQLRRPIGEKS